MQEAINDGIYIRLNGSNGVLVKQSACYGYTIDFRLSDINSPQCNV